MYQTFFKRFLDIFLSLFAIIVLSPIFVILIIIGTIMMKGNPFFIQERAGKREKRFNLIKFRTMTNAKDKDGKLLPGKDRLNRYGRLIRSLSIDELPSLINILRGDLSIIGPRPLPMKYLSYYTETERRRYEVSPGLTGLAQCMGRNNLSWEDKFAYDVEYVDNLSFLLDVKILFKTAVSVLKREGIGQGEQQPISLHIERMNWVYEEEKSEEVNI